MKHESYHAFMAQLSIRVHDGLAERVRSAAGLAGRSMNQYVVNILDAATDPELETDDAVRVRERLARAGLLEPATHGARRRPDRDAVAAARRRAGRGTPLSELVSAERR